jgi:hypothetical protein
MRNKNFPEIFRDFKYLYIKHSYMSKRVIRLTESDLKNYIRKVISEQQLSNNRPHDKMVINCLLNAGFKVVNTNGKYDVYLKNSKCYYVFSDQKDPNKFYFAINDGSLSPAILNLTPGNDNCKTIDNILATQNGRGTNKTMYESETGNKWVITKEGKTSQGDPMREYEKICKGFKLLLVQIIKTTKEGTKKAYVKVILHLPNSEKIDMTVQEFKEDWIPMKDLKDPLVHKLINNSEAFGEYKVSMSKVPGMKRY